MITIMAFLQVTLHQFIVFSWFCNYYIVIYSFLLGVVIAKVSMISVDPQWLKGQQVSRSDWKKIQYNKECSKESQI